MGFQILDRSNEILDGRRAIQLPDQRPGLVDILRRAPERGQGVGRHCQESLRRDAPGDVFDVRLKPLVLVDHDHARPFCLSLRPCQIGTNRSGATGICNVLRIEARIIPGNDLGVGIVLFQLSQHSVCCILAAGKHSQLFDHVPTIQVSTAV